MNIISTPKIDRVDFSDVSDAALATMETLIPRLLPGGYRSGDEWVCRNPTRNDNAAGSFKVNLRSGVWSDFATGDKGGDAIDLMVYLEGRSNLEAAHQLAEMLGVKPSGGSKALTGNIRPVRKSIGAATPAQARTAPQAFPPRTIPNAEGKPSFIIAGDEGPRVRPDEKRRHVYYQGGVPVRMKIIRDNGEGLNSYRVSDGEQTGWQYRKPNGFEVVPYFTGADPFEMDQPIYWPEGEKDTDTLARLGLPAFTFGGTGDGLPDGCWSYLVGRSIVILADNDKDGRMHADCKAVAVYSIAASVKIVHFPDTAEKGDVSDWMEGRTAADLAVRAETTAEWNMDVAGSVWIGDRPESVEILEPEISRKPKLPLGFSFSDRGLMWQNPDDLDKPAILIAGHFDIVAETRDADGTSWGVLLEWCDHDDRSHLFALPRATLAGDGSEARRILMDGGFYIAPSQTARGLFNSFLLQVKSPSRARATARVGWHGNAFVLPDHCFGNDERDALLLQNVTAHEHSFRQSGTLESWQNNVARYAIGNSRLVLALSAAFAGPLVGPCSAEGGGLHFKGASSTGKSTALHVAGSTWGGGDDANGYVRSWRATANGLEGVALGHTDTLLCLDELSQLAGKDAGEAAYMLANGAGKSRSSRDGSARKAAKWRVLFLSSGEIGLADKVGEDGRGKKLAAGQQVRIVDVAADAGAGLGMFENLHGFASAEILARHLRSATQQHYGVAAREYLAAIVPDIDDLRKQIDPIMRAFCEQYVPAGADGQVERVAQRFALVAVGGEMARQYGILPWPAGEAIAAAGRCFLDWLAARGGHDAAESRDGIEQVRSFLSAHGMSRFVPAWEEGRSETVIRDVAGYRKRSETGEGWDFYVTATAWKEEVCRGIDAKRLAATMAERGYIDGPADRRAKTVRVPEHGQQKLYHVLGGILEDAQ